MPWSNEENKPWIMQKIVDMNPTSILDVGAGAGTYGRLLRGWVPEVAVLDAVEIWEPYIERFHLENIYDHIFVEDIRQATFVMNSYDVIILGDILEHMTKEEAVDVWNEMLWVSHQAVFLSIPIIHYPQGEAEGNPYEAHVKDDWTTEEILDSFMGITEHHDFDVTGVFMAERKAWKS